MLRWIYISAFDGWLWPPMHVVADHSRAVSVSTCHDGRTELVRLRICIMLKQSEVIDKQR
jgi:hypothetical protein